MDRLRFAAAMFAIALCLGVPDFAQAQLVGLGQPAATTDSAQTAVPRTPRRSGVRPELTRPDSPRGAVAGFLAAARAGDYKRAATFLDLSNLDSADVANRGAPLARQLKFVLDRTLWIDVETLSESPDGDLQDGLSPNRERIGTISTQHGPVEIRLRRGEDETTGAQTWRFSPNLVDRIPDLYDEFGPGPLGRRMPPALYTPRFLEIELWQWLSLIIAAAVGYGLAVLLVYAAHGLLRLRAKLKQKPLDEEFLLTVRTQARLILALGIFLGVARFALRLSIPAQHVIARTGEVFLVIVVTWGFDRVAGRMWKRMHDRLQRENRRSAAALSIFGERLTRAALITLGAVVALQQVGFQITGLLAGLGIGGVAVALAAQKTIENLFGGFSLATDQPIRLGDYCQFGDKTGWVVDVGMRSTRIRTIDRSIITIPNSEFAEIQLENLSMRDRMRLSTDIGLRYETTPEQLRNVLAAVNQMLAQDARVVPDPLRVRFKGFGAYSLDIEVMTYVATTDQDEFLAIREDLFLKIMDIVNENGASFAFPSQTIYAGQDTLGRPPEPSPPATPG